MQTIVQFKLIIRDVVGPDYNGSDCISIILFKQKINKPPHFDHIDYID